MDIQYIQQFKDREEVQLLDDSVIDLINELFSSSNIKLKKYNNNDKKQNFNNSIKASINRIDNKTNFIINKISDTNTDAIIKEFITTFNYLTQDDFNIVQKCFFVELIKNDTFQKPIYDLYNNISIIYSSVCKINENYFINLIENKILNDYIEPLNDDLFNELNNEDNRINFLNLLHIMLNNKLNNDFVNEFTNVLLKTNEIPDIICWFRLNNIDKSLLEHKKEEKLSLRYNVLLENILNEDNNDNTVLINIDEDDNDDTKTELETEIDNIIEEYLFLKDFDEVRIYCKKIGENNELTFITELLIYYFTKRNTDQYLEYKNLFTSLYSKRIIKKKNFLTAWFNVIKMDLTDYTNIQSKKNNIKQIYNLLNMKI